VTHSYGAGHVMADIYISYAPADRGVVETLAEQLQGLGHATWWGRAAGPRSDADHERVVAGKVIVLWTKSSISSPFVVHDAIAACDADKLVQVRASDAELAKLPRVLAGFRILDVNDVDTISLAVRDEFYLAKTPDPAFQQAKATEDQGLPQPISVPPPDIVTLPRNQREDPHVRAHEQATPSWSETNTEERQRLKSWWVMAACGMIGFAGTIIVVWTGLATATSEFFGRIWSVLK
jgi:hypothetical protein